MRRYLPKQSQLSRSVLQDGSRSFGLFILVLQEDQDLLDCFGRKKTSYNRRNDFFLFGLSSYRPLHSQEPKFQLYVVEMRRKGPPWCVPGRVAQSVGHLTHKSGVLGSIPGLATYFRFSFRFFKKGSCQLLAKVCARSTG